MFFARELGYETVVVADAIKELDLSKANSFRADWKAYGVEVLNTRGVEGFLEKSA